MATLRATAIVRGRRQHMAERVRRVRLQAEAGADRLDRRPGKAREVVHLDRRLGKAREVVHLDRRLGKAREVVHPDRRLGKALEVVHPDRRLGKAREVVHPDRRPGKAPEVVRLDRRPGKAQEVVLPDRRRAGAEVEGVRRGHRAVKVEAASRKVAAKGITAAEKGGVVRRSSTKLAASYGV
jgi:hypothetical protein